MNQLTVSMTRKERLSCGIYLLFELFLLPELLQLLNRIFSYPWSASTVNFLYFLLNFLVVITLLRRFLLRSLRSSVKTPGKFLGASLFWFCLYWIASAALSWLIVFCNPDFININDSAIADMLAESPVLMALGTVLFVPLVEECLYRGFLFGSIRKRSRILAYAVSAAVFCAVHVMPYIGTYSWPLLGLCFLQYLPAGLCLAGAYEKADNIFAPILIHTTVNALGMIAMR